MSGTPIYLRDLSKDMQAIYMSDILRDEKLKEAFENNEDIQLGVAYFYQKPKLAD